MVSSKTSQDELERRVDIMMRILQTRLREGGEEFLGREIYVRQGKEKMYMAYMTGESGAIVLVPRRLKDEEYVAMERAIKYRHSHVKGENLATIFFKDRKGLFRHIHNDEDYHKLLQYQQTMKGDLSKEILRIGLFSGSKLIQQQFGKSLKQKEQKEFARRIQNHLWTKCINLSSYETKVRSRSERNIERPVVQYVQEESARKKEDLITYQFNEAIVKYRDEIHKRLFAPESYAIISEEWSMNPKLKLDKGLLIRKT